jgi:RNA polymerase sigma factor (sigma-70 family)
VNREPFQRFLDAHRDDVWRLLVASVGREAADDCFQETFLAALRAWPDTRPENPRAWILTIAHRKAIDHVRARARRPVPVGDVPEQAVDEPASYNGQDDLWRLVRGLPPKQRTAIALRYVFDAAHADIASVMGTSEDAARRNVHEGLKRLRTEYER